MITAWLAQIAIAVYLNCVPSFLGKHDKSCHFATKAECHILRFLLEQPYQIFCAKIRECRAVSYSGSIEHTLRARQFLEMSLHRLAALLEWLPAATKCIC